jgi:hypothetical protein
MGPHGNPNVWAIVDGQLHVWMFCNPFNRFLLGDGSGKQPLNLSASTYLLLHMS